MFDDLHMKPTPLQRFILKCIYGQPLQNRHWSIQVFRHDGSVRAYMTEREYLDFLYARGMCNVKEVEGREFKEVFAALGRRHGKTEISNMIAYYEWQHDRSVAQVYPVHVMTKDGFASSRKRLFSSYHSSLPDDTIIFEETAMVARRGTREDGFDRIYEEQRGQGSTLITLASPNEDYLDPRSLFWRQYRKVKKRGLVFRIPAWLHIPTQDELLGRNDITAGGMPTDGMIHAETVAEKYRGFILRLRYEGVHVTCDISPDPAEMEGILHGIKSTAVDYDAAAFEHAKHKIDVFLRSLRGQWFISDNYAGSL